MRRLSLLAALAAVAVLVVAAPASAHTQITWWDRGTGNSVSNTEVFPAGTVSSFSCGETYSVDNNPGTPDIPRVRYLDIPDNDQVVGWGVSLQEFGGQEPGHFHTGGAYGAGGFNSDGYTTLWLPFNGYPDGETLGVRHSMKFESGPNRFMKVRADGGLFWLIHRVCPPPG